MYRTAELATGLLHLVGWRQNYDTVDFSIAASLTASTSGQYFQDVHPLVTLDNIKSIAPNFPSITFSEWVSTTPYLIGDRRKVGIQGYRAILNGTGHNPTTSPTYWEEYDGFSEWLEIKTKASIVKVMESLYSKKLIRKTMKNLLESKALFDGAGRIADTIANEGYVVGLEVVPVRSKGVTTKIHKIGIQATGAGTIKMYLFHSSQSVAIETYDAVVASAGMTWFTVDWNLPYLSNDNDAGGSWYVCYYQDAMPTGVMAINKVKDWSAKPCYDCSRLDAEYQMAWSKYLEIHPFRSEPIGTTLWEVSENIYTYEKNYGLNLQITVECDLTDFILEQKLSFQNLIALQVASDMIREMAYNANFRVNRTQTNFTRQEMLYELDGDSQGRKSGINYQLSQCLESLDVDLEGIDRVCLPCNNNGVMWRSI